MARRNKGTSTAARIADLAELHTYARPAGSRTERAFIVRYVASLPGVYQDDHDNWIVRIGAHPRVAWSCHTDTVARHDGRQRVTIDASDIIRLHARERRAACLGADDSAGVWILREMIAAAVPGLYLFHAAEEIGGIGSSSLARYSPETLDGIDVAIALDRRGTGDVVTYQAGGRTCSDVCAQSIADAIHVASSGQLAYTPCSTGVYTDTAEYAGIVAECTNLSVGYASAHSAAESVAARHVLALADALIALDQSAILIDRVPAANANGGVDAWPSTWDEFDTAADGVVWGDDDGDYHDPADYARQTARADAAYLDRQWDAICRALDAQRRRR